MLDRTAVVAPTLYFQFGAAAWTITSPFHDFGTSFPASVVNYSIHF